MGADAKFLTWRGSVARESHPNWCSRRGLESRARRYHGLQQRWKSDEPWPSLPQSNCVDRRVLPVPAARQAEEASRDHDRDRGDQQPGGLQQSAPGAGRATDGTRAVAVKDPSVGTRSRALPSSRRSTSVESLESLYRGHRFRPEIVSHAVWLYQRVPLRTRLPGRSHCGAREGAGAWSRRPPGGCGSTSSEMLRTARWAGAAGASELRWPAPAFPPCFRERTAIRPAGGRLLQAGAVRQPERGGPGSRTSKEIPYASARIE